MSAPHGVIPPLVTPLHPDGTIDPTGLTAVVRRVIAGGVHGLFVLGTTGEATQLSDADRRLVIDTVATAAAGRVPLFVQVTDTRLADSLALAHHAAAAGAAAVVIAAPHFLPLTQPELVRYVDAVLAGQPLPVVLYNIPQCTGTRYEVASVRDLLGRGRVVGLKDSSRDLPYQRHLIATADAAGRPDFAVLCGSDRALFEMVRAGAAGGVSGGANLLPELLVALYDAARRGTDATALLDRLAVVGRLLAAPTIAGGIHRLKAALHQSGRDRRRPPLRPLRRRRRARRPTRPGRARPRDRSPTEPVLSHVRVAVAPQGRS